jgi:hypothetical protein
MGCVLEVDVDGEGVFFVDKVTASSSSSTPAFFYTSSTKVSLALLGVLCHFCF